MHISLPCLLYGQFCIRWEANLPGNNPYKPWASGWYHKNEYFWGMLYPRPWILNASKVLILLSPRDPWYKDPANLIENLPYYYVAVNKMTYWSSVDIPGIELEENKLDTILRILPKQLSSVGAYTVTATSYALLAYMEKRATEAELDSIQRFLQEQHINVGGFYSSQVIHLLMCFHWQIQCYP